MERGHVVLRHGMEKRLRVYDIGHGTWDIKRFLKADSNLSWVCIGDFNECCKGKSKWNQMIGRCGKLTSLGKWLMCVSGVTLVI